MEQGTYSAVKPDADTAEKILRFIKKNNIINPVPVDELHVTLMYSRKELPNYKPNISLHFFADPIKFAIWPTKSGKNCLVLEMDCPALVKRHEDLMKLHNATYDYAKYKVHMSLSYDVGDLNIAALSDEILDDIIGLTDEYTEELDVTGK